jgi:hypothetical protein
LFATRILSSHFNMKKLPADAAVALFAQRCWATCWTNGLIFFNCVAVRDFANTGGRS